jgi:SAM-dependent methyltransferase
VRVAAPIGGQTATRRLARKLKANKRYPPIPTDLTHAQADYLERIAREYRYVLDIGSGRGFGTVFLARGGLMVDSVDWHLGTAGLDGNLAISPMGGTLGTLFMHLEINKLLDKVNVYVAPTAAVLPKFQDAMFDLAMVDGEDLHSDRLWDLLECNRLVRPGGVILTRLTGQAELALADFRDVTSWRLTDGVDDLVRLDKP